jgi:hypothetical protein
VPSAPVGAAEVEVPNSDVRWKASRVVESDSPDSPYPSQNQEVPRLVRVPIDQLPPATASRKAYLSSGWWHINMAFQPTDSLIHHVYQPKWLKFREDQTFDILEKNKVVDSGRWNWDETKDEIYFACNDPYVNNTWVVTTKGFVMILKGNTSVNVTGIQLRLVNSGNQPSSN